MMNGAVSAKRAGQHQARVVWTTIAAASLGVGIALFVLGVTPWVAPAAVLLCLTLSIGQHTSWPFAIAASMIVELALIALIVRFTPSLGLGLVNGSALILGLLGVGGIVAFARVSGPRLPDARVLRIGLPVLALPVVVVSLIAVTGVASGALEWAMHNDAVWNIVTTRLIVEDGGLEAISHPNASPLTPGLLAVAIAIGRGSVAPSDLLAHDIQTVATFWLLATLTAAILAGLIGARSVHGTTRWARLGVAAFTALIPLSWFTFGFAAQFGFYNATVTLVLLLASWLAWLEARVAPLAAVAVLSLATVALLATWAPLAAVPFALAVAAAFSRLSALPREWRSVPMVVALVLAVLPVPLYVLAVTLPDLQRDGAALAVDGGIMTLLPEHVLVIVAVTLAVTILTAVRQNQTHQLIGVIVVCIAGAAAGSYLTLQRVTAGASAWGYYPAKFAWLVVSLLIVVLATSIASELAGLRGRRLASTGVAFAMVIAPVSLMLLVPPTADRVVSLLTPVAIVTERGVAAGAPAAQLLFELAEPGERTIVMKFADPAQDRFINSWLLQLESVSAQDPIRAHSYVMDPDDVQQVCAAVEAWAAPVRVVTSDAVAAASLQDVCADAEFVVDVLDPSTVLDRAHAVTPLDSTT